MLRAETQAVFQILILLIIRLRRIELLGKENHRFKIIGVENTLKLRIMGRYLKRNDRFAEASGYEIIRRRNHFMMNRHRFAYPGGEREKAAGQQNIQNSISFDDYSTGSESAARASRFFCQTV